MYVLPSAYKEDFEKIVNKYQKERKGRILWDHYMKAYWIVKKY
jgi:hypothetical protein